MELLITVTAVGLLSMLALVVVVVLHRIDPSRAAINGEVARPGVAVRFAGGGLYAAFLTVFAVSLLAVYLLVR